MGFSLAGHLPGWRISTHFWHVKEFPCLVCRCTSQLLSRGMCWKTGCSWLFVLAQIFPFIDSRGSHNSDKRQISFSRTWDPSNLNITSKYWTFVGLTSLRHKSESVVPFWSNFFHFQKYYKSYFFRVAVVGNMKHMLLFLEFVHRIIFPPYRSSVLGN